MIRVYFYVEGQTEQAYAETVLRDHLANFQVFVEGAVLAATKKRQGIIYRGGGRHYLPMKNDLVRLLKSKPGRDVRFTTMFDLYSLYHDFPAFQEAEKLRHLPHERALKLEVALAADIADPRLIPYLQLHEFEAVLFSQPEAFAIYYDNCERQIQALRTVAATFPSPELINDGQDTSPSKRIAAQFPDYTDAKLAAAIEIATVMDLQVIRSQCPHFNEWLTRLEHLDT
jgi:hypothetical protein